MTLPKNSEIRKLFSEYRIQIKKMEIVVPVAQLTVKKIPALVVTGGKHRTEFEENPRKFYEHMPRYKVLDSQEVAERLADNGYNVRWDDSGIAIIPADVTIGTY